MEGRKVGIRERIGGRSGEEMLAIRLRERQFNRLPREIVRGEARHLAAGTHGVETNEQAVALALHAVHLPTFCIRDAQAEHAGVLIFEPRPAAEPVFHLGFQAVIVKVQEVEPLRLPQKRQHVLRRIDKQAVNQAGAQRQRATQY